MKVITIAGNIGKDAEIRQTQGGDSVTSWSVATTERGKGGEKRTLWFDCTLWGKRGEALASYLTKGSKVAVSGEFSTREHEGRTYLTIRASEVTLMGDGGAADAPKARSGNGRVSYDQSIGAKSGGGSLADDLGDSLPF